MATLTTQVMKRTGVAPTYSACAGGGDRFTPGANTFLHVKNTSGAPINVTVAATKIPALDMTSTSLVVSIPATTGDKMIGPLPADIFTAVDGSGLADVTYSAVTSLTIAVVQVQQP